MLRSIRTRLALSYALIILLCLLLTGIGALVLVRRYQRAEVLRQRRAMAKTLSQQVQRLYSSRLDLPELERHLRQEAHTLGVRALLVQRDGLVLADTGDTGALVGQQIRLPLQELSAVGTAVARRRVAADGQSYFFIAFSLRLPTVNEPTESSVLPAYLVAVVPEQETEPAWRQLAPPLLTAGAVSLCISAITAFFLSRSITRPLIAMTEASEAIARGDHQQVIRAQGHDEVARLADSFNRMAREVEHSRQSQRDFLANVSHDLKTPLTSILGFSQAILEGAVRDEAGYRRAAQVINEEAGRMGELVRDLLDLARLDAGAAAIKRTPIAVDTLAQDCLQKLTPLANKADVTMQLSTEADLPLFHGDEERLEQALSNLLDNAIKYTPTGGRVDVEVGSLTDKATEGNAGCTLPPNMQVAHRGWLAIRVKDTGPGIPREDLPRIFERFYRADKSRGGPRGSGLGLAIAKEIVETHGGMISGNSRPGGGSCFTILLPVD